MIHALPLLEAANVALLFFSSLSFFLPSFSLSLLASSFPVLLLLLLPSSSQIIESTILGGSWESPLDPGSRIQGEAGWEEGGIGH